ncbi:hypothetical protein PR202_ga15959 [Eleusine coracana subsp. coracana]|uniref:Cyclin C-terminal domain-containing protein n=1 Tax=Eleusine coracana subsp. coracana TaxID=191504 RepID=A0AAV5CLF2_ELECO|nr:hypothetical protein PR202_ga15959 [Eleusine coracana subsp. coracana]
MPDDASYLLCTEDAAAAFFDAAAHTSCCTTGDDDDEEECCSVGEEESASIAELIGGEAEHSPRSDYPDRLRSRSIDPAARAESVAWILKVRAYYGFLPLTAYLAVNYMDRFLSLHHLPVDGTSYIFDPQTIVRMELLVLTALNWRLRSVTPFTFIDFFACKVDPGGRHARCLIARATQVILSAIHDIEFLDHCPSSMAAAAVLCAMGDTPSLKPVSPGVAVNWCIGLAEEGISNCYQRMQQLVICNVQRSVNLCFSDEVLSPHSSSSSPPPAKRRKRSPRGT